MPPADAHGNQHFKTNDKVENKDKIANQPHFDALNLLKDSKEITRQPQSHSSLPELTLTDHTHNPNPQPNHKTEGDKSKADNKSQSDHKPQGDHKTHADGNAHADSKAHSANKLEGGNKSEPKKLSDESKTHADNKSHEDSKSAAGQKQSHEEKHEDKHSHGLFGKITGGLASSAEHAVQHVENGVKHAENGVKHAAGDVKDAATTVAKGAEKVNHQATLFSEGVATGAVLDPINGATELINHAAGTHINKVEFSNQKEVDNSIAGKVGKIGGQLADAVAITAATGGAGGALGLTGTAAKIAEVATASAVGAVQGGVFTPTDKQGGGSFLQKRLESAALGSIAPATTKAGETVSVAAADAIAGTGKYATAEAVKIGGRVVTQSGAGPATTEGNSLITTGKPAPAADVGLAAIGIGAADGRRRF